MMMKKSWRSKRPQGGRPKSRPRPSVSRGALLMQRLITDATSSFPAWHIEEPKLIFAGDRRTEDPKTGITVFGPRQLDQLSRQAIRIGVVGTGETVQLLHNWLSTAEGRITAGRNKAGKAYDAVLAPDFPGFSPDSPFRCALELDERLCETLPLKDVEQAVEGASFSARVRGVVEVVAERLGVLAEREPSPDVVICAMPELVDRACGPQGRRGVFRAVPLTPRQRAEKRMRRQAARVGQMLLAFPSTDDEPEQEEHWDFHNALKVHAMRSQLPTQLIWESTLAGTRDTQDPATIAWNFFTALFYKAGNVPWELGFEAPGTCFVGVTFYRERPGASAVTRVSLAQVFSETGDGLVLRGEPVEWDRDRDRKPHLSEPAARKLLEHAIQQYEKHFNKPRRVVVHKTSRYWPEELAGFKAGLGDVQSFDFLTLERRGIRFLRLGHEPPLRGTVIQLARRNYLLYTRGYVPYLRAYPGMRVPNPIEIAEHHGDSSADKVCSEILALTKLNWNNCGFASRDPITIAFSRQVGRILTELPAVGIEAPLTKYKYYM